MKVPQDNKEICLAVHPITFWLDQSCVKKMIVSYILLFIKLQLIFPFCAKDQKSRKEGDVRRDCLLSVDGTDFRLALGCHVASETKSEDTVENDLYADDLDNNGHNNDICVDNNGSTVDNNNDNVDEDEPTNDDNATTNNADEDEQHDNNPYDKYNDTTNELEIAELEFSLQLYRIADKDKNDDDYNKDDYTTTTIDKIVEECEHDYHLLWDTFLSLSTNLSLIHI